MTGIPSSYRVRIWYGKTRMAGLQSGEGRMMIDSVVWAQYINVTDTQTATSPQRIPPYTLASGSKVLYPTLGKKSRVSTDKEIIYLRTHSV